jgi:hypothetical protein
MVFSDSRFLWHGVRFKQNRPSIEHQNGPCRYCRKVFEWCYEPGDEVKTNLVSTVSHELKTPLTSIRMGLHLLLEERIGPLNPKQLELSVKSVGKTVRFSVLDHDRAFRRNFNNAFLKGFSGFQGPKNRKGSDLGWPSPRKSSFRTAEALGFIAHQARGASFTSIFLMRFTFAHPANQR